MGTGYSAICPINRLQHPLHHKRSQQTLSRETWYMLCVHDSLDLRLNIKVACLWASHAHITENTNVLHSAIVQLKVEATDDVGQGQIYFGVGETAAC